MKQFPNILYMKKIGPKIGNLNRSIIIKETEIILLC